MIPRSQAENQLVGDHPHDVYCYSGGGLVREVSPKMAEKIRLRIYFINCPDFWNRSCGESLLGCLSFCSHICKLMNQPTRCLLPSDENVRERGHPKQAASWKHGMWTWHFPPIPEDLMGHPRWLAAFLPSTVCFSCLSPPFFCPNFNFSWNPRPSSDQSTQSLGNVWGSLAPDGLF